MKKGIQKPNFWEEMAKRPYPFNRESTMIAQAISPWGGMGNKEREKLILDLSEGNSIR